MWPALRRRHLIGHCAARIVLGSGNLASYLFRRRPRFSDDLAADSNRIPIFASLRTRNYRLYFIGQGISVAGSWMQNIAIGWLALEFSNSGAVLGLVVGARFVPRIFLGPMGGVVADRVDNRRLLTVTQASSALLSLTLAGLTIANIVNLGLLLTLVAALGLVNVFDVPSRQSLIGQLVDRRLLGNAITLNSMVLNAARVLGPGVGGAVIAVAGVGICFLVNGLSFVAVIASLLMMRASEMTPAKRAARGRGQIREGFRYVLRTPDLALPLLMVTVTGVLTWEFPVSLPLMITDVFNRDASGYGVLTACLGIGALFGGLLAARRGTVSTKSLAVSAALWSLPIICAALAPTFAVELYAIALVGSGAITFNSAAKTLLQLTSAPEMRGRVMALWSMAWQGSAAIGAPIIGSIGAYAGARYGLLIGGLAAAAVGMFVIVHELRRSTGSPVHESVTSLDDGELAASAGDTGR